LDRAISAELLKLKRTLALRIAIGAPLLVALLNFVIYMQGRGGTSPGTNPLIGFAQINLTMWTILVLPMYATLSAALIAALDHQGNTGRLWSAFPVPRRSISRAKWLGACALLTVSSVAFSVEAPAAAALPRILKPAWQHPPIPAGLLTL